MTVTTDTIELAAVLADRRPPLAELLARPGTQVVLLAGSKDPNAKITLLLLDSYGPAFAVKVPTTRAAARVVRNEGYLLEALAGLALGDFATTIARPVGYLSANGLPALVSTALTGAPMTQRYHSWRHTASAQRVRDDFAAAGGWLGELQARTAGREAPITLLADSLGSIAVRFPRHAGLSELRRQLDGPAARLAEYRTPRTVVHGDYWFGNLLLAADDGAGGPPRVTGVVDWESGAMSGEPLRDLARFAVSYALYLDRHVKPGRRVPGHPGLRSGTWGAGLAHLAGGRGWFPRLAREYLMQGLDRLGVPAVLWPYLLVAGIAEVAASADHPEFARAHLDLLIRLVEAGAVEGLR
jgi:phosphotransferase family enzyme